MGRVLLLFSLFAVLVTSPASLAAREERAGAPETIQDLTSKEVTEAAQAAVNDLNRGSNSMFKTVLVEVTQGTVQVVQGLKYVLTLRVGRSTECRNDGVPASLAECPVSRDTMETWEATIWYRVWYSPQYEVLELVKVDARIEERDHGSHLVGAPIPLEDLQDAEVLAAAQEAVKKLNKRSNSLYKLVLMEVSDGTVQVVNGAKYTLNILVGMSAVCRNDGKVATLKKCPVVADTLQTWHAVILRHPTNPPEYDVLELDKLLP